MSALPEKGWRGYGSPQHPLTPQFRRKPYPNRCGVMVHELHAEVAEYRLSHDGIKPELLAYIKGIGEQAK